MADSIIDVVSNLKNVVTNISPLAQLGTTAIQAVQQVTLLTQTMSTQLSALTQTLSTVFPRAFGTFALANATITNVAQPTVHADSFISFTPIGASAGSTYYQNGLFIAGQTAGVGFTVSTHASSAAGGEVFSYVVFTPG